MNITFLRKPAAMSALGIKAASTFYLRIQQGLMTSPVHLGPRTVGFPKHEIEAINSARLAGKPEDEIRQLVASLEAARKLAA
ncbi:MAG: transcriptional regulator [bacterium]|nr:transcriptional regulator [bacterium]